MKKTLKLEKFTQKCVPIKEIPIVVTWFNNHQKIEQKIMDLKNRRVEILSSATLPESPINPKTRLIVALSAVVSIFVGIFLVFVIEFIKNAKCRINENEEGLSPA